MALVDDSEFAADQGKEALNFQLTLLVLHAACLMLVIFTLGIGLLVLWPVFLALFLGELFLGFVAALKSYEGKRYRYPFTIRFIS